MTFWSKSDPIRTFSGTGDHWTKIKRRAEEQAGLLPEGAAREFDCYLYQCFNGNPPGSYHSERPMTVNGWKTFLTSSYNRRARNGFVYWNNPKTYRLSTTSFAPRDCKGVNEVFIEEKSESAEGGTKRVCFGGK